MIHLGFVLTSTVYFVINSIPLDVFLVIQPFQSNGTTMYSIHCVTKKGVLPFGPYLPDPPHFTSSTLREFLITKLINAERSAYFAPGFLAQKHRVRKQQLLNIIQKVESSSSALLLSNRTTFGSMLNVPRKLIGKGSFLEEEEMLKSSSWGSFYGTLKVDPDSKLERKSEELSVPVAPSVQLPISPTPKLRSGSSWISATPTQKQIVTNNESSTSNSLITE